MSNNMVWVELLKDYKCCWKKGDQRDVLPHFAQALIDLGYARAVDKPSKDKMIKTPLVKKGVKVD